jgi:hypothetical protein
MDFSNHSRAADKESYSHDQFDLLLEIHIKSFRTECALNKPIDYPRCVSHLLSRAHRFLTRGKSGHSIREVVGGTIEALACDGQFSYGLLGQRYRGYSERSHAISVASRLIVSERRYVHHPAFRLQEFLTANIRDTNTRRAVSNP